MHVRFWGTRGSIPTPGPQTAGYGGNTSCVEVRSSDGTFIILDCGTGIRDLGLELLRSNSMPRSIYLLIGHTHWDHIQGFPFFSPAFLPGVELNIFAPVGFERGLEDAIAGQMQYSYFPVKLQDLASRIYYKEVEEGFFRIGNVFVETQYLNHTAPTIGYRLRDDSASVAYVTDHEPYWNVPGPGFMHPGDRRHVEFLRDVDLLIHDAQYTTEEYRTKYGWGHSTIEYAADVAIAANVGKLALFHHDPSHNDVILKKLEDIAQQRAVWCSSKVDIFCAAEGLTLEVAGKPGALPVAVNSALDSRGCGNGSILLLTENRADVTAIEAILAEDNYAVSSTPDIRIGLQLISHLCPDMIMISATLDGDGAQYIEPLREACGRPELPVLLLATMGEDSERLAIIQAVATDYIGKPFSPPMLRSRVRAWRARSGANSAAPAPSALPSVEALLASSSLFNALDRDALAKLHDNGQKEAFAADQSIMRQGEKSDSVYIVLSGRVRVLEAVLDNPTELVLHEFGPGEVFGELGVILQRPRSATVLAVKPTTCLKISEADFVDALRSSQDMTSALLRIVGDRLYDTDRLVGRNAPDRVTGLLSRGAFHDVYSRLSASARRRSSSILLLALDIVHLKKINDEMGYNVGDDVLRVVADTLVRFSSNADLAARYGGDEFAALLIDVKAEDTAAIVERLRAELQATARRRLLPVAFECSIGYAMSLNPSDQLDDLLRQADHNSHTKRARIALVKPS